MSFKWRKLFKLWSGFVVSAVVWWRRANDDFDNENDFGLVLRWWRHPLYSKSKRLFNFYPHVCVCMHAHRHSYGFVDLGGFDFVDLIWRHGKGEGRRLDHKRYRKGGENKRLK